MLHQNDKQALENMLERAGIDYEEQDDGGIVVGDVAISFGDGGNLASIDALEVEAEE